MPSPHRNGSVFRLAGFAWRKAGPSCFRAPLPQKVGCAESPEITKKRKKTMFRRRSPSPVPPPPAPGRERRFRRRRPRRSLWLYFLALVGAAALLFLLIRFLIIPLLVALA